MLFRSGNLRNCVITKKTKARAGQTSRSIQTYQGALYGSILGRSSGLDGMKRRFGVKFIRSSLSLIIYDGKISI